MTQKAEIRFTYSHRPWFKLALWLSATVITALLPMYYIIREASFTLIFAAGTPSMLCGFRFGVERSLYIVVTSDSLVIVRRALMVQFNMSKIIPLSTIANIRYSREKNFDGKRAPFRLDVVTVESDRMNIIKGSEEPLPRDLGRNLAAAIGVPYEESIEAPAS